MSSPKHVVLKKTALRTQVGGAAIMRHQLDWLYEQANRSNVALQVLPADRGAHPSMTSSFITLRFSGFPHFGIRDSKQGDNGPQLWLPEPEWTALVNLLRP